MTRISVKKSMTLQVLKLRYLKKEESFSVL
jgi:hypothetical protein